MDVWVVSEDGVEHRRVDELTALLAKQDVTSLGEGDVTAKQNP